MGNCIISKLGGSVNNDELLQLGDIRLVVKTIDETYAQIAQAHSFTLSSVPTGNESVIEIIGEGHFTDSTLTQNLGKTDLASNKTYYVSEGDYSIIIHTGYTMQVKLEIMGYNNSYSAISLDCDTVRCKANDIRVRGNDNLIGNLKNALDNPMSVIGLFRNQTKRFDLAWFEPSQCKDTINSFTISGMDVIGSLSALNNLSALTGFEINAGTAQQDPSTNAITGDLSDLVPSNQSSFTKVGIRGCSLVTGNISSLGNLYNLTQLFLDNSRNLTGSLETFLDAVHANGRISGKMAINIKGTSITYDNLPLTAQKTVTFSSDGWTLA